MYFNETISFAFVQTSTYFKVVIEKQLSKFNLHGGQIFILFELWKTDGLSQIELAAKLGVSPPTVNKMIKSLSGSGFVGCSKCPSDGRIMRVFLTPMGAAIRPKIEEEWLEIEKKLFADLTATEQLVLSQLFKKISESFAKIKVQNS